MKKMTFQLLMAGLAGLLFGLGLILSGMTNPAKIIGFLDITGAWDPTLAFVMGAALIVAIPAFALAEKKEKSLLGMPMLIPTNRQLDKRLILGSLVFGAGWGLAGYCPGPAIASLFSGQIGSVLFVVAMLVGMQLFSWLESGGKS
jgi:uncharacterized protein